jgi:siroheme synthase
LVETPVDRGLKLQAASEALISLGCAEELPVLIIAKTAPYRQREQEASLRTLPGLAAELADEDLLTLVFGPVAFRYPAPCRAFTANGLAG